MSSTTAKTTGKTPNPIPTLTGNDAMPDWRTLYDKMPVENMPWYNPDLDFDLALAIEKYNFNHGRFLDLGTGPGTQAIELARLGFDATGTDISTAAIAQAKKRAEGTNAVFVVDDILHTKIEGKFDFIFDRGCFHCFEPKDHPLYLASLMKLLAPGGTFFLKCFSAQEPGTDGPKRFTEAEIRSIFFALKVQSVEETIYYGNVGGNSILDHEPKSLFSVLKRT